MLKILLYVLLVMAVLAAIVTLVERFKTFFIILAILLVAGFFLYLVLKFRKAKAKRPAAPLSPVDAAAPEALQGTPKEHQNVPEKQEPKSKITAYQVKGIFAHEDEVFHNLMEYNEEYDYSKADLIEYCVPDFPVYKWVPKDLPARLIPEPDNEYDPNAIRVVVGEYTIGYIPKESCLVVLDVLNSDRLENVACEITGGAYKLLEEDYDPIKDKSKYTVTTGREELAAKVYIKERITK